YSFIPAETVRGRDIGSAGTLLLGVGRRDGVRPGATLVTAEGLVGAVRDPRDADAVAIDWTHPEFRVSVMTVDGETYGIARPTDGPGGEKVLAFSPQAFHTAPDTGAMIVTSGDGAVYPRGVPVGKVIVGSGKQEGGWQREYLIRPLVTPAQMAHVLVLGEPIKAPTDQDLASAWGIRLADSPRSPDSLAAPVSPDAATPTQATQAARPRPAAQRPRPRFVDPTPELPGKAVDPTAPRVPEGLPPPTRPRRTQPERRR
ncbi:MAG TPA: rod shape-determining protein MreC, partial [Longimicrobiaceae bacterium]|nr:rod shape-determining protein MreC [Longimicrobiaceae bacterium]